MESVVRDLTTVPVARDFDFDFVALRGVADLVDGFVLLVDFVGFDRGFAVIVDFDRAVVVDFDRGFESCLDVARFAAGFDFVLRTIANSFDDSRT